MFFSIVLLTTSVEVIAVVQPRYRAPPDIPVVALNGRDSCNLGEELDRYPDVVERCAIPLPSEPDILDLACFGVYDVLAEACERSRNSSVNLTGVSGQPFSVGEFCHRVKTNPVRGLQESGNPAVVVWRGKLEEAFNNASLCPQLCQVSIFCQLMTAGYEILLDYGTQDTETRNETTEQPHKTAENSSQPADHVFVGLGNLANSNSLLLCWCMIPLTMMMILI